MFIVKSLVSNNNNVNINEKNLDGMTAALIIASQNGQLKIVEFLVPKNILMLMLKKIKIKNSLILSCKNCHLDIVEFPVSNGVDKNQKANGYPSALTYAVNDKNSLIIRFLLKHGATVELNINFCFGLQLNYE